MIGLVLALLGADEREVIRALSPPAWISEGPTGAVPAERSWYLGSRISVKALSDG